MYHLSFLWYSALGATTSVIVACLATRIFGTTNLEELDPALVSPFMRRFLPLRKQKEYMSVSLEDFFSGQHAREGRKLHAEQK